MFSTFLDLTKAKIVLLVGITVVLGFLIGQEATRTFDWIAFLGVTSGTILLAAGSSALNQIQETSLDQRMARTRERPLPSGRLELSTALGICVGLLALGTALLALLTPKLVLIAGWVTVVLYNGAYTRHWKPRLPMAAVPGAIPGALPVSMGYWAADPRWLAPGAWYLFAILFFWQMPHFWALAIKYREDYARGGFPVLPVAHGIEVTLSEIRIWTLCYVGLGLLAPLFFAHAGSLYLSCALLMGLWLLVQLRRFTQNPDARRTWLGFFLGVSLSLLVYLGVLAADLWKLSLFRWVWT